MVNRDPEADVLHTRDVVVRLVLMPRSLLFGLWFLDQCVIVVQPHLLGFHQLSRYLRDGRIEDDVSIGWDSLPVAEVLEEPARVRVAARCGSQGSRIGDIPVDCLAQLVHLLGGK